MNLSRYAPTTQSKSKRPWWATTSLGIGSLVVLLMAAEVVVRVSALAPEVVAIEPTPASAYQLSENPLLGYELKADYSSTTPDGPSTIGRTNSVGLRDPEHPIKKPDVGRRVALLGGSVVAGEGLSDQEIIARQLENAFVNGNLKAINCAVAGYSVRAQVDLLEKRGLRYRPDEVIVVVSDEDFRDFNESPVNLAPVEERPLYAEQLYQRSALFRLFAVKRGWFHFGALANAEKRFRHPVGLNTVDAALKRLSMLAKRDGITVIVSAWPRFRDREIRPSLQERIVGRMARKYGLQAVSLLKPFTVDWERKGKDPNPRLHYTNGDGLHPSRLGSITAGLVFAHVLTAVAKEQAGESDGSPKIPEGGYSLGFKEKALQLVDPGKAPRTESDRLLYFGEEAIRSNNKPQAAEYYRQAILADPTNARAQVGLATTYMLLGDPESAAPHFEAAEKLAGDDADIPYNVGVFLNDQGETDRAFLAYEKAIDLNPKHVAAHVNLGAILQKRGEHERALVHYEQALAEAPDNESILQNVEKIRKLIERK